MRLIKTVKFVDESSITVAPSGDEKFPFYLVISQDTEQLIFPTERKALEQLWSIIHHQLTLEEQKDIPTQDTQTEAVTNEHS